MLCYDVDPRKIDLLDAGEIPIHEPGLPALVDRNRAAGRLRFTTDAAESVTHGRVQFIAVGTPPEEDGSADLKHVVAAARAIADALTEYRLVVDKSTVPVGTADAVRSAVSADDSFNNRTYADGMMASVYGEWPPLVNVSRKPGEWQSLDIVFEAPRFTGRVTPGSFTVFWNGAVVHNRAELYGTTTPTMTPHVYTAHDPELPLQLQGRARVRYRNVWIRRLKTYDQGARIN